MHSTSLNCFLKPFTWIFMAYHYINIHQIDVQIICQNNISIQWSKLWAWPKEFCPAEVSTFKSCAAAASAGFTLICWSKVRRYPIQSQCIPSPPCVAWSLMDDSPLFMVHSEAPALKRQYLLSRVPPHGFCDLTIAICWVKSYWDASWSSLQHGKRCSGFWMILTVEKNIHWQVEWLVKSLTMPSSTEA